MAVLGHRARNLGRWLRAAPPHRWRLRRHRCPSCGGGWVFAVAPGPARARCAACGLTGTALSLLPVLADHLAANPDAGPAWEMSTHGPVRPFLARHGIETVETEYLPGVPSGTVIDGVRCEDVTATSFGDASLGLVTCNQVFEHVEDHMAGFAECHRVLRPGGALIFAVPLGGRATRPVAETVADRVVFHGRPEHHGSRLTGPGSVPVFWHFHGPDVVERLRRVGFAAEMRKVPYLPDGPPARVFYARKPEDAAP